MAKRFSKFGGIFPLKRADPADGNATIAMTLKEFAEASCAVEQALKFFDNAPLLERFRSGATLLPLEQSIIADILEEKIKRPRRRLAQPSTRTRKLCLALAAVEAMLKGMPRKNAVKDVAETERVSVATVSAALRENAHLFPDLVE